MKQVALLSQRGRAVLHVCHITFTTVYNTLTASCASDLTPRTYTVLLCDNPVPASGLWSGPARKLISSSMSQHLSTCHISSKCKHAFLSNLANRQTDKQTNMGKTCSPSSVEGKMNDRTIDHITLPALAGGVIIHKSLSTGITLVKVWYQSLSFRHST